MESARNSSSVKSKFPDKTESNYRPIMNTADENIVIEKTFRNPDFESEGGFVGFLFFPKQRKLVNVMTELILIWDYDSEEILFKKIMIEDGLSIIGLTKHRESEFLILCEKNGEESLIFKYSVDKIQESAMNVFTHNNVIHKFLPLNDTKSDLFLCVGDLDMFIISISLKNVMKNVRNHGVDRNKFRQTEVLVSRNYPNSVYIGSPTVRLLDVINARTKIKEFDGHIIQQVKKSQNFSQLCLFNNFRNEEILLGVSEWFHPDFDPRIRKSMDLNKYKLQTIFLYNTSKSKNDPEWMKKFNLRIMYDRLCANVIFNRFLVIGEIPRSLSCHDLNDDDNVIEVFRNETVRQVKKVEQIMVSPGRVTLMLSKPFGSEVKIVELKSKTVRKETAKNEEMKRLRFLRHEFGWEKESFFTFGYFLLFRLENKCIGSILKLLFFLEI